MVYINDAACNGCGECAEVCPNSALVIQNNQAVILQELCEECEICIDACPQSAILSAQELPDSRDVIQVPVSFPERPILLNEHSDRVSMRDRVLPVVGSVLLWSGRELLPRLADVALGYLDRRIQYSSSVPDRAFAAKRDRQVMMSNRKGRRVRRRQRVRKSIQTIN
jgi:NAD-dependent dihydropyrimidine dehydrogenase PreA subunit